MCTRVLAVLKTVCLDSLPFVIHPDFSSYFVNQSSVNLLSTDVFIPLELVGIKTNAPNLNSHTGKYIVSDKGTKDEVILYSFICKT